MVFKIHFELENGEEDCVTVSGDTIEEVRELAELHVQLRRGKNPWSEEIITYRFN